MRKRKDNIPVTEEARLQQLKAKAERLAEQRIEDGTAASQIIVHYLKVDPEKERLEREILECQKDLIKAKTDALKYAARLDSMFDEAMATFKKFKYDDGEA